MVAMFAGNPPRLLVLLAALALISPGSAARQDTGTAKPATGDTADSHLGKGYDALRQDRYEVAVSEFRAALALDPKLTLRARFPLAVALFEMHESEDARRELEAVRREVGEHPNVSYYLGRLDLEDHNFGSAIQHLTKAMVKPPFPDTAYYLGFAYFKQGDLAAAEKWLKEAAHDDPQEPRVQYQLGLVYRKQGREEEAKRALALSEKLRQRDADLSKLQLECAQKLDEGSRDEARAVCDQLYDPDNADKLTALGSIYGQHGDPEGALKPFRRAAKLAPQSPQTQYNLAMAYYQLNQFEAARGPLENALKRWPDLFQLNALYGAVLSKLDEDSRAYQALHHAHQLNEQDSATTDLLYAVTLALAQKSQSAQQHAEALHYFDEAAKLRPQEPAPHRGLAEVYGLLGRHAEAAAEKEQADRLSKSPGGIE